MDVIFCPEFLLTMFNWFIIIHLHDLHKHSYTLSTRKISILNSVMTYVKNVPGKETF